MLLYLYEFVKDDQVTARVVLEVEEDHRNSLELAEAYASDGETTRLSELPEGEDVFRVEDLEHNVRIPA